MDRTRNVFLTIFGLTFFAAGLFVLTLLWRDKGELEVVSAEIATVENAITIQHATLTAAATLTPPPTATPFPTATPMPDYLATTQAEATTIANVQTLFIEDARAWPLLIMDTFDDNSSNWDTEPGDPELSIDLRSINDGAFIWEIAAVTGFFWVEALPDITLPDPFYLALDVEQTGDIVNEQALAFHVQNATNYYYFALCEDDEGFSLRRRIEGEWHTLFFCTASDSIKAGGVNRLAVLGNKSHYRFFINDIFVKELRDDSHQGGDAGVFINMGAGDQNTFRFDNLEIRSPATTTK